MLAAVNYGSRFGEFSILLSEPETSHEELKQDTLTAHVVFFECSYVHVARLAIVSYGRTLLRVYSLAWPDYL